MHGSFDKFGGDGSQGKEPSGSDGNEHNEKKHDLGFAGGMAKSFIHSPLSPLLFVAFLLMGILGLFLTPRQEDPQISVPMADVFISYPGASAEQVASLAIDPLERMMSEIPGVEHVYSAAQRGQGMVTVQFKVGQETGASLVKLYDKLKSNADQMPPGVSQPLVKPKGADDVPVVTLTLWSNSIDDTSLRQVALEMRQRLKEVPDTASSFIVGGRSQQCASRFLPNVCRVLVLPLAKSPVPFKAPMSKKILVHQSSRVQAFLSIPALSLKTLVIWKIWLWVFARALLSICVTLQP